MKNLIKLRESFEKIYNEIYDTLDEVYVDEGISWKAVEKFIKTDDVKKFFDRFII